MRRDRLVGSLAGVALAVVCAVVLSAQQPARDNAQTASGTATISGTVLVDGPTRPPARRTRVTLTDLAGASPGQTTTTDDRGTFAFRNVPAGRFEVKAFKSGYLRAGYGASRPDRTGTPIVVNDGDAIGNIAITIARGGVITGIVRDSRGRPVPGLDVKVLKLGYNAVTGERMLTTPGSSAGAGNTDDRGEYRVYGLPPGNYLVLVMAGPGPGRSAGQSLDDMRPLTTAEVEQALQAVRGAATNTSPAAVPPALSSSATRVNYAPVFYPGVADIGAAAPVALGLSEERSGIDVAIQLVPTATISGTLRTPPGVAPALLRVTLLPAGPQSDLLTGGLALRTTTSNSAGTYSFGGVAPGAYTIKASTVGGRPGASDTPLWAAAEVRVNGQNMEMPLTLEPGVAVAGRVIFEGAAPTPDQLQTLSFGLVPPGSSTPIQTAGGGRNMTAPVTGRGQVGPDGRFTISEVPPDAYRFVAQWTSPGASSRWTIKSAVANGRDVFDAPIRVNPNEPVNWTITYTDTPTHLTGVFQDRTGRTATDYFILVFPADRQYWVPGSRRIQMARPATTGTFSAKGLPAGEYFLAALSDLETGEWNDPTLLESLVGSSIKVTLRDGGTTTQDVRIGGT